MFPPCTECRHRSLSMVSCFQKLYLILKFSLKLALKAVFLVWSKASVEKFYTSQGHVLVESNRRCDFFVLLLLLLLLLVSL